MHVLFDTIKVQNAMELESLNILAWFIVLFCIFA